VEENVMGTQRLVESPVESVEASGSVAQGFRGRRAIGITAAAAVLIATVAMAWSATRSGAGR
jgi:hypothetical protein